jgi:hypothetical protein
MRLASKDFHKNILQNIGTLLTMVRLYGKGLDFTDLRKIVKSPSELG